jgi:glyoxylase-like metal-dependent hydrolase (beta-lactamase superfamily II)
VAAHAADLLFPGNVLPYPHGGLIGRVLNLRSFTGIRRRLLLESSAVDIVLHGNEQFDVLGGMTVVNTPGHTAGSISLYFPAHKLLMVGDALNKKNGVLRLPLKTAVTRLPEAATSIRTMAALDVEILCFGHGRPVTKGARAALQSLVDRLPR